jgi:amino acid adenylation domain-containing protein
MQSHKCLHEIFADRAREVPGRIALTYGDENITYGDLNRWADALADRLRALGGGPGMLVGLCIPRGTEMIAGLLGILKAGAAYVPIDPDYPAARIEHLLGDSGVSIVVSTTSAKDRLGCFDGVVVSADEVPQAEERTVDRASGPGSAATPVRVPEAGDLAYVIYTSGSTGRPKGVMVEHGNVVRLFGQTESWLRPSREDVWALFHSVSFDFSVWEIWGALLYGGRLVVMPREVTRSPARTLAMLRDERITVLNQTPSAFHQLCRAIEAGPPADGLSLRFVIFGGERLSPKTVQPWMERYGDESPRLVNMYGVTETTVHVTYREMRIADLARPEVSLIGVPIPDLQVDLIDGDGRPVPEGTPGEIHVSGPGVARGYLNQPALTEERFGRRSDGAPMYRSGDIAAREPNGELRYLGRTDDQIKVRGFRIEPAEVEACLTGHRQVSQAFVVPRDHGDSDIRLDAYLVLRHGPDSAVLVGSDPEAQRRTDLARVVEEVRRLAAAQLPIHMRPSSYHTVADVPRTPEGKVARSELARVSRAAPDAATWATGSVADGGGKDLSGPVSTLGQVTRIAQQVLGCSRLEPDMDLFDIGATSLALVRIIAQINKRFGVGLTGSELEDAATAAVLARCVDDRLHHVQPVLARS